MMKLRGAHAWPDSPVQSAHNFDLRIMDCFFFLLIIFSSYQINIAAGNSLYSVWMVGCFDVAFAAYTHSHTDKQILLSKSPHFKSIDRLNTSKSLQCQPDCVCEHRHIFPWNLIAYSCLIVHTVPHFNLILNNPIYFVEMQLYTMCDAAQCSEKKTETKNGYTNQLSRWYTLRIVLFSWLNRCADRQFGVCVCVCDPGYWFAAVICSSWI